MRRFSRARSGVTDKGIDRPDELVRVLLKCRMRFALMNLFNSMYRYSSLKRYP